MSQLPLRIAFCITDLDPGGAEKALFQIVSRLDPQQWNPVVLCLGPEAELSHKFRAIGVTTLCYGARSWRAIGAFAWLQRELDFYRPVLLQSFLFHANVVSRIAGRRAGIPVIVSGHRVAEKQKRWHLNCDFWTLNKVDHHICVSQGVADYLQQQLRIPKEKLSVIGNGVTIPAEFIMSPDVREEFGFQKNTQLMLAVGRLHHQKGFDELIDAIPTLIERDSRIRLIIVGEGPERARLQQQIEDLSLSHFVSLAGYREDVNRFYAQANLLVVSSRWEGMSNVLLEALAHGLPVLTTRVEGVEELAAAFPDHVTIVDQIRTGFENDLPLPEALDGPVFNRTNLPLEIITKHFTWERISQKYAETWLSLLHYSETHLQSRRDSQGA